MKRHSTRAAVTLCVAASLAATLTSASASGATSSASTRQQVEEPVLVDCFWRTTVRPDDFVLACGDGNSRLESLKWLRWDGEAAMARGVNWVNDCKPYCAAGQFRSYPVTVRLEEPKPWKKNPDLRQYGEITLTYLEGTPEGFTKVVTYPLWS